jgi:SAM-dependent methyltransferase
MDKTEVELLAEESGRSESADVVVPLLRDLVRPASVLDVGCGPGTWLAAFSRHGVNDFHGVDSMPRSFSRLDQNAFELVDLGAGYRPQRRYDLALCIEVAEHLPAASAGVLIDSLVAAAPVVAFAAAIPGQGGIGHINEQWPSYWRELFATRGYLQHDVIRGHIWDDTRVRPWYRQNLFLYAEQEWVAPPRAPVPEAVVHPELFRAAVEHGALTNRDARELLEALVVKARRRLAR